MARPLRHLVVARHEEDLSWLPVKGWRERVVQKDVDLPNEGREASSYLHALHELYPRVSARTLIACVQGNPFPHCEELKERLLGDFSGFTFLGHWMTSDDRFGNPNHGGLALGERFREWLGEEPPERFEFAAGAQFVVSGELVKSRPRKFYRDLYELSMTDEQAPWIFERFWGYLWKGT